MQGNAPLQVDSIPFIYGQAHGAHLDAFLFGGSGGLERSPHGLGLSKKCPLPIIPRHGMDMAGTCHRDHRDMGFTRRN